VLYYFFPKEQTNGTIIHVIILTLLTELAQNCAFVANFSIILRICDKRVSGIYISLLAALTNFSFFIHKTYIFTVVEYFGLFGPQIVISIIALTVNLIFYKRVLAMDNVKKESWWVSDAILCKQKTQ